MKNPEEATFECSIFKENSQAICFRVKGIVLWIPTSQILKQEIRGKSFFITIPIWLAQSKGILDV